MWNQNEWFNKNLVFLRERAGLTQTQAARRLKENISTYAAWEEGRAFPRVPKLIRIVEMFKVKKEMYEFLKTDISKQYKGEKVV